MFPIRKNVIWNEPFRDLQEQVSRMLGQYDSEHANGLTATYPVDIHEDDEQVLIEAELPGFTKDQIELSLEDGVLSIRADRQIEMKENNKKHLNERRFTRIHRSFSVPASVDASKVDAELDHGVLKITLHKREEVLPKRIPIQ